VNDSRAIRNRENPKFSYHKSPFQENKILGLKSMAAGLMPIGGMLLASVSARAADDTVETAVKAGSFNTLVAAVMAAGLVETLKRAGPSNG
jgi:hypothetical protein